MRITFNMKGLKAFQKRIGRVERGLHDRRALYKLWGIEALNWIHENYRTGGGKVGGWKGLTSLTVQSRRKGSNKPLLDTGHMMRQWHYDVQHYGVRVGNPMDIAKYHHEGTKPYTIRPKNKKALWFGVTPAQRRKGQIKGFKKSPGIFARGVNHPGLPKRRQLPTETEIMPRLQRVSEKWIDKLTK